MKIDKLMMDKKTIYVIVCSKECYELKRMRDLKKYNKDLYIVNNPMLYNFPSNNFTPKQTIKWCSYRKKSRYTFENIIKLLEMEEVAHIYNRKWKYIGNFKWICSVAVGIVQGKKYFVMPWLSKCELDYQEYRLEKIFNAIKMIGGTIVCPIESIEGKRIFEENQDIIIKNIL